MKETYIAFMEKALSAYSDEHILRYFRDAKENGLTEHGFPRLTANIGILIAHGRRKDLSPLFIDMMELCCDMFLRPYVRAANEFSVREIVCCIDELEKKEAIDRAHLLRWKQKIARISPEQCYNVIVQSDDDRITNWAIFGAVSEYARVACGLGDHLEFIDRQLSCQFQWLDDNGMYRDHHVELPHQPMVYDCVSRGLLALLLHLGYRGKYYEKIDACLKNAGILTLSMQSTCGEIPFGGRSNQFLHNEAWMMLLFEYEARRYASEGNLPLAMTFKSAVARAFDSLRYWLSKNPIRHIKNRFETETKYGCEEYAYFDKYMITVASNLYAAYLVCDDDIPTGGAPDCAPSVFETSPYFHKLFLKSGGYALEFDTNADPHYDANGLGRVHREGAPPTVCLSCPCPAKPFYTVDTEHPMPLSLCSAIYEADAWHLGADASSRYEVLEKAVDQDSASAILRCTFQNGKSLKESYRVSKCGVLVTVEGDGKIGYVLPALVFDGERDGIASADAHSLTVSYEGFQCRYTVSGTILPLHGIAANRNGHYRPFLATSENKLTVQIEITESSRH